VKALEVLRTATRALFLEIGEAHADLSYAPGKWTPRQILGHLADDERIFAYRALCICRGDSRPLSGFDENAYTRSAGFESRSIHDLLAEYESVRNASITLFARLDSAGWTRRGVVNDYSASVRGLAFHIAGHELHHHRVLRRRYLVLISRHGLGDPV
jgi:hypothetical protein